VNAQDVIVANNAIVAGEQGPVIIFRGACSGLRLSNNKIVAPGGVRTAVVIASLGTAMSASFGSLGAIFYSKKAKNRVLRVNFGAVAAGTPKPHARPTCVRSKFRRNYREKISANNALLQKSELPHKPWIQGVSPRKPGVRSKWCRVKFDSYGNAPGSRGGLRMSYRSHEQIVRHRAPGP
jgi:hypothetical protein